ncbi:MAG: prevent-host-death protein, partial [Proteobacteria bacterium]|nr:prevent-host-death protein [Pseudomonadota bacterium]
AKLVPMDTVPVGQRIGVARGKFEVPDTIGGHNDEVERLFLSGEQP